MDVTHVSRVLPLEIELIILQTALESNMKDAKNLLFVAKYVFDWLIPILYRVVVLGRDTRSSWPPLALPIAKLPQYGRYVQHLFIMSESTPRNVLDQYLQRCPNIVDLASWKQFTQSQIEHIVCLPLHQLKLSHYARSIIPVSPSILTLFSKITHLDAEDLPIQYVSHFPSLTHLILGPAPDTGVYNELLKRRPALKVLIVRVLDSDYSLIPEVEYDVVPGLDDPRVVHLNFETWEDPNWRMNALGDPRNAWSLAERVVEERLARVQNVYAPREA